MLGDTQEGISWETKLSRGIIGGHLGGHRGH